MRCLNCGLDGIMLRAEYCPRCQIYLPAQWQNLLAPSTILGGRYEIDYPLGRGGFGVTYRAVHQGLEKLVAIKEYYPQEQAVRDSSSGCLIVPKNKLAAYERGVQRFFREGQLLASLDPHPHVVQVTDCFQEGNTAYLVMEFLKGDTLRTRLSEREQGLPEAEVKQIMAQLVSALSVLHRRHVYHLDLKPDNIMLAEGDTNRAVLIDFGASRQGLGSHSTRSYTEAYAPLELIRCDDQSGSGQLGAATDIFELGMMLHELLTGQRPPTVLSRLQQETWDPETLRDPWRALIRAALHLHPHQRPQSVTDWWTLAEPEPLLLAAASVPQTASVPIPQGRDPQPRRWLWSGVGAVVGVAVLGIALGNWPRWFGSVSEQPSDSTALAEATPSPQPLQTLPPPLLYDAHLPGKDLILPSL